MRLSRFAVLTAMAALVAGCAKDDGPTAANIPPLAYVRYINAIPDTNNTTVRFIDAVEFTPQTWVNTAFRSQGQGGYQGTRAGNRRFRVFGAMVENFGQAPGPNDNAINTSMLLDTTINFEAGKYYTLLHAGYARSSGTPRQRIIVLNDDIPTPAAGNVAVRVINLAFGQNTIDAYVTPAANSPITGTAAFPGVALNGVSAYRTQATGAFAIQATPGGSTTPFAATLAPAGVAGTTAADPIGGSTIGQSVITAIIFPAKVTGSPAANFTTPGVAYFVDRQPPRTTP